MALDWGLIVPVIRNADEKNILGLSRAVNDLADRARAKKLKVDEVQGGTFTVTNPGVFGSLFGTPIINQPQVAILGIGTIEKRAVVRDDAIAIRTMAYFALTFDHRIVDGADADRFMAHIKKGLSGVRRDRRSDPGGAPLSDAAARRPPLLVRTLGRIPYADGLHLQEALVAERQAQRTVDVLLLLEHDPVFTTGRNANAREHDAHRRPRCGSGGSTSSRPAAAATSPTTAPGRWSATRSSSCRRSGATCIATCATSRRS